MHRYFIELSYNGTPFHGWQRQPNAESVQQRLEEALSRVMRIDISVTGAGRTDTGVHARKMYAHFDSATPIADRDRLSTALNRLCGPAIAIEKIHRVSESAHARFDALSRTYKYFIRYVKDPFVGGLCWETRPLDLEVMNEAASLLKKTDDFTSFAKLHSDSKTNICKVSRAEWEPLENGAVFTITADRFLRNMVRAVVGTLVEVGRGKTDTVGFRRIIERQNRCAAGTSMPAHALFLWDITYPDSIWLPDENI